MGMFNQVSREIVPRAPPTGVKVLLGSPIAACMREPTARPPGITNQNRRLIRRSAAETGSRFLDHAQLMPGTLSTSFQRPCLSSTTSAGEARDYASSQVVQCLTGRYCFVGLGCLETGYMGPRDCPRPNPQDDYIAARPATAARPTRAIIPPVISHGISARPLYASLAIQLLFNTHN